jgi:hypothetical protein
MDVLEFFLKRLYNEKQKIAHCGKSSEIPQCGKSSEIPHCGKEFQNSTLWERVPK